MHDLMHDLAQTLLQLPIVPEKEGKLPGLGLSVAAAHGELLDHYMKKAQIGKDGQVLWHTLTDDGYIFAHLTWHMERAKRLKEIHRLLQTSDRNGRNGWYLACEAIGKPAGFVNDMGRAWRLSVERYNKTPGETVALLFRYALMRGSLNSMASNVTAEMVGGLVKEGFWQVTQGLAYAQQAQDPWRRAECISAISPYLPKTLLPDVLNTVGQIRDAVYRSYVLSKLAEYFPEIWPDVLTAIRQIEDHKHRDQGFPYRALALDKIMEKLPFQYLSSTTEIKCQIQDVSDSTMSLVTLAAQHLPDELWPEAIARIREIQDSNSKFKSVTDATDK